MKRARKQPAAKLGKRYDLFISYSGQSDRELATSIQHHLQHTLRRWNQVRAMEVFVDLNSLGAPANLETRLYATLDHSDWVLLLASPESADSPWVTDEVCHCLSTKAPGRLLIAQTGGHRLNWNKLEDRWDPAPDALASSVVENLSAVPRVIDLLNSDTNGPLTPDDPLFGQGMREIIHEITGIPTEDIDSTDQRQHKRRMRVVRTARLSLVLLTALALATALFARAKSNAAHQASDAAAAQQFVGEGTSLLSSNDSLGLLVSLEAYKLADTQQARDGLAAAASVPIIGSTKAVAPVESLAFNADGTMLAVGDNTGIIELHSFMSGSTSLILNNFGPNVPPGPNSSIAFCPDGNLLVESDIDAVYVENLTQHSTSLTAVNSDPTTIAFDPTTRLLASGNTTGQIILDYYAGDSVGSGTSNGEPDDTWIPVASDYSAINSLTFSPNGQTLATGTADGQFVLRNLRTDSDTTVNEGGSISDVAFSTDGTLVATGNSNGELRIQDLATGAVTTLQDGSPIDSIAFSPNGRMIISGDADGHIVLHMLSNGSETTLYAGASVSAVAISPNGALLATAASEEVNYWSLVGGLATTSAGQGGVTTVAFSPDGRTLASGSTSGTVTLQILSSGLTSTLAGSSPVDALTFSPDSRTLAVGDEDGVVVLNNLSTGQSIDQNETGSSGVPTNSDNQPVHSVAFSPNGKILASNSGGVLYTYYLLSPPNWGFASQSGWGISTTDTTNSLAFSPSGTVIANTEGSSPDQYDITLQSSSTGAVVGWLDASSVVNSLAYCTNGKTLISGEENGTVSAYNVATKRRVRFDVGSPVLSVAVNHDCSIIAAGTDNGGVLMLDVRTGSRTQLSESSPVTTVAFSPDGDSVASGNQGGQVEQFGKPLWSWTFPQMRARLCREVGNLNLSRSQWSTYFPGIPYNRICPLSRPPEL